MEGRTGGREGEGDRLNALRGSGADSSHWGAGEASAGPEWHTQNRSGGAARPQEARAVPRLLGVAREPCFSDILCVANCRTVK